MSCVDSRCRAADTSDSDVTIHTLLASLVVCDADETQRRVLRDPIHGSVDADSIRHPTVCVHARTEWILEFIRDGEHHLPTKQVVISLVRRSLRPDRR